MIKPIETVYNGYRFRSRLEARWAVFFDAAGIEYQYELEGYETEDGIRYLPDFYLPVFDIFCEVKPNYEKLYDDWEKIEKIIMSNNSPIGESGLLILGQIPKFLMLPENSPKTLFYGTPQFMFFEKDLSRYALDRSSCGGIDSRFKCFIADDGKFVNLIEGDNMCHTLTLPGIDAESALDALLRRYGYDCHRNTSFYSNLYFNNYYVRFTNFHTFVEYTLSLHIQRATFEYLNPCFEKARMARFEYGEVG